MNFIKKIAVFTAILLLVVSCKQGNRGAQTATKETVPKVSVLAKKVQPDNLNKYLEVTGRLEGKTDITMRSETNGRIEKVNKELGDWVNAGDKIGKINNDDLKIKVSQAKSAVNSAEANYETAKLQFESSQSLRKKNSISKAEFQRSKSNLKNALALLEGNKANLKMAQKALDNSNFRAPVSGYITNIDIEVGETIGTGNPVCSIVNSKKLKIKTGVSEIDIYEIKPGQKVEVYYDQRDIKLTGKISNIGIKPAPNDSNYPIEIELDNPNNRLYPGLVVKAQILKKTYKNKIYTSMNNIVQNYDKHNVFTIDQNNTAHIKEVTLGDQIGENVIINSGLKPGDLLVTEGLANLEEGTKVEIKKKLQNEIQ